MTSLCLTLEQGGIYKPEGAPFHYSCSYTAQCIMARRVRCQQCAAPKDNVVIIASTSFENLIQPLNKGQLPRLGAPPPPPPPPLEQAMVMATYVEQKRC